MSNEEGTPKRRRGLFRRDRTKDTATAEPRLAADGFDDPWSASAWDDWDDDFTARNLRSSVPAAAAPRPEAVDAWLQSEADDFDTATRLNAKRWGGEANREPAAGLSSLRQNTTSHNPPPAVDETAGVPELLLRSRTLEVPTSPSFADWASDSDVAAADTPAETTVATPAETPVKSPVDEMPVESPVDDMSMEAPVETPAETPQVAPVVETPVFHEEAAAGVDDATGESVSLTEIDAEVADKVFPTWAPVDEITPVESDYDSDGDLDDVLDALADEDAPPAPELVDLPVDPIDSVAVAAVPPPVMERDELRELDEIEPSDEFTPELAVLDEAPPELPAPIANWAPVETIKVRLPAASASSTVDDRRLPVTPSSPPVTPPLSPPSRFVSVSVVDDEPALPEPVAAAVVPGPAPSQVSSRASIVADNEPERLDASTVRTHPEAPTPPVTAAPPVADRSRRWADLAAEFGSDGDLEDSFPRRARVTTPAAPAPVAAAEPTVDAPLAGVAAIHQSMTEADPAVIDTPAPVPEPAGEPEPMVVEPDLHAVGPTEPHVAPDRVFASDPVPAHEHAAADDHVETQDLVEDAGPDEVDPWSLPPVRAPRRPVDTPPPVRSRLPQSSEPAAAFRPAAVSAAAVRPAERATDRRPSTGRAAIAPAKQPVPRAAELRSRPATEPRASNSPVLPELSRFAGIVGSVLVGFAIARLVLALLGDQPTIPATFTATTARLVRFGATFTNIGTSWPLALLVGTVLLVLPVFAGITDHLRRWAPLVGLASVTAVASLIVGALQFYAGNKLGTPSTLRLLSDVVIGPVGFGALTLATVVFGIRAHRR